MKKVIIIQGPAASGKTILAESIAQSHPSNLVLRLNPDVYIKNYEWVQRMAVIIIDGCPIKMDWSKFRPLIFPMFYGQCQPLSGHAPLFIFTGQSFDVPKEVEELAAMVYLTKR